ncbi:TRAF-like protein [Artemisia annua]|uniref:TRAF-like protein n=1 Tax=Artemisia annua TaxID=35608 RepID=A0A2U1LE29_ARTAN|nr:TRAF-like protein [Artemisia annua]
MENKGVTWPHLIVSPKVVLRNWINEFSAWAPSYQIRRRLLLTGTPIQNNLIERSPHPPVPYAASGQQGPGQPRSHLKPPGHGYSAHGPHLGDSLQSPGPNQPGSQGEPLGPPINSAPSPHGLPDGQSVPRHLGPMELDMYQNQRPPYFDGRRADSHLHGDADMGPYGQPLGVDTHLMSMTAATKHPSDSNQTSRAAASKRQLTETPPTAANKHPLAIHQGSTSYAVAVVSKLNVLM